MKISDIIQCLETFAPPQYQESYDNAGLITGSPGWECRGVLVALDCVEATIREAIDRGCNLVVAHHPIVFTGLKRFNSSDYVGQTIIAAIKNDVAIYAAHTNLDNVKHGVNRRIADRIGLRNTRVLSPKQGTLKKLFTFVPADHIEGVRQALFEVGAGVIGNYDECSFSVLGEGTFRGNEETSPFVGTAGLRHTEKEYKVEMVFPAFLQGRLEEALKKAHPYEEVAYDVVDLANAHPGVGAGLIGELPEEMTGQAFLALLRDRFQVPVVRHTALTGKPVRSVAVCGGAGSFLTARAAALKADCFVSADFKYHQFFDANNQMIIADIGHYESEQFTVDLLSELLGQKFPSFAVLKTKVNTNPVFYFTG